MSKPVRQRREKKSGTAGRNVRALASYLVAGACLYWVFHDVRLDELLQGLSQIYWGRMALCVALEFLAYFCVAWEWQLLLRPTGALPLRRAAQAVFAGRFANDALPLQLGYLVRAVLAARWMNVSVASIFPSLIVERLWDGIWLALGIVVATFCLSLPPAVIQARNTLGTIVLVGVVATAFLVLRRGRTRNGTSTGKSVKWKFVQRVLLAIRRLTDGVREIGRSHMLAPIIGLSLLKLLIQAAAFLGLLWAYGLYLPVVIGLVVFLVAYVGISVPSTPAGTGMFQLFVVGSLKLFGIEKSVAAGFALAAFVAITAPLAIAGFFALAQSGLQLRQIRSEAGNLKNAA